MHRRWMTWSGSHAFAGAVALIGALLGSAFGQETPSPVRGRLNVLFIAVDDLRPELGCCGVSRIRTPNIDSLAARGMRFDRAYCQQAVCSPSRTSLLTGLRPDTTRIYDLQTHFRLHRPEVVTLPELFKKHGYHTEALGKIYHGGLDDPRSWSVKTWKPRAPGYAKPETLAAIQKRREALKAAGRLRRDTPVKRDPETGVVLKRKRTGRRALGPAWEDPDVPDSALPDGKIADRAIERLEKIKDRPFFLAVGFLKPHLPFVAPKRYFDLYPPDSVRLPPNRHPPRDVPRLALMSFGELRQYAGIPPKGPVSETVARELIRAYYASVSFVDAQIGRLLDAIDRLGLRDSTVVVLWGDHGWQLGEHGLWCKHTNFEVATRAPLLFAVPGRTDTGMSSRALVEFVDVYPTLCRLCGLEPPDDLEGESLVPLLEDPGRPWKRAAFSQYPRGRVMGYSMRTDRYRYTEWRNRKTGRRVAEELYDHQNDPGEDVNRAASPGLDETVARLRGMLRAGWRSARP